MESPGLALSMDQIEASMQADAMQQLQAILHERLPQLAGARPIVGIGSAADQIAQAVADEKADLLIIATHGASGWREIVSGTAVEHLLFGSVATNVLRLTSCSTLTVRLPLEAGVFDLDSDAA